MTTEKVHTVYEPVTGTWQYIVVDTTTNQAVIIDSVLDYSKDTGVISTASADRLLDIITEKKYTITHILETHAHADHLSASRYLQNALTEHQPLCRPVVGIGKRIVEVQQTMGQIYHVPEPDLDQAFDVLFDDNETFSIGNLKAEVVHLPGHTPDHVGYVVGHNIFTGDSIFNPDVGSARCDFPNGSASHLYQSTRKLLNYPGHFRLYTGHDYPPASRTALDEDSGTKAVPFTTVKQQREENQHVNIKTQETDFVSWRSERDSNLKEPKLLRISIETNIRGGRLPAGGKVGDFTITTVPKGVARIGA